MSDPEIKPLNRGMEAKRSNLPPSYQLKLIKLPTPLIMKFQSLMPHFVQNQTSHIDTYFILTDCENLHYEYFNCYRNNQLESTGECLYFIHYYLLLSNRSQFCYQLVKVRFSILHFYSIEIRSLKYS